MKRIDFSRTYDYYSPKTLVRITYKRKPVTLKTGCGNSDYIAVFKEGKDIILLTYNYRYDYVGVEVFYEKELDDRKENVVECCRDSEYFWQGSEQIHEGLELRKDWTEYSINTLARYAYYLVNQFVFG